MATPAPVYASAPNQIAALKELYTNSDDYMKDLVFKKNPMYALMPKDESPSGFAGKYIPVPLVYGAPQGRSHTFANAQDSQTAPALGSFFVYRVSDYQVVSITNELLEATAHDAAAFVDEAKLNMDTGFRNFANNAAFELFGSGTASRGSIGTIVTNGATNAVTITLNDPNTAVNFDYGMTLVASLTDGGTPSADYVSLSGVNFITGVLTGTASVTPSSGLSANWATNSFLIIQGDSPAAANTAGTNNGFLAVSGLQAWIPTSVATNDNFWGVNRSASPQRLAGLYQDFSNESIEEALIDMANLISKLGGEPNMCFMNFTSFSSLLKSMGAKVQNVQIKHDEVDISFQGITLMAAYGPITVIPDRSCPSQTAFMLQMDTWKLRSLGKVPHVLTYGLEGLEGIRVGTADALEIRIGAYYNLICSAPGWNGRVLLSD
jgi:Family of unknown function (DUF5309)